MSDQYAQPEALVSTQWVADHAKDPNVRIVESNEDVLLYDTGHIPGAVNHFFKSNLADDGTMLAPDVLRQGFLRLLKGRASSEAVMYCGSGVTACQNLLAMEHAALPGARLYVGSWSEWSADPARPTEKGPSNQ